MALEGERGVPPRDAPAQEAGEAPDLQEAREPREAPEVAPPPPSGTVEAWLHQLVTTEDVEAKLTPAPRPERWESAPPPRHLGVPGRPSVWEASPRAPRKVKRGALAHQERRCQLIHTFFHHELQAAELFAWAALRFPDSPEAFRKGLLTILDDELRHMRAYQDYLQERGVAVGSFPYRDWFWQRVPQVRSPVGFVALMGLGLEGGNLDHASRYARWFREAGDPEGAAVLEMVCEEEVRHVRFAAHWFRHFTGSLDFDRWRAELPDPLTPKLMRGPEMNRRDRLRGGQDESFLAALAAW